MEQVNIQIPEGEITNPIDTTTFPFPGGSAEFADFVSLFLG